VACSRSVSRVWTSPLGVVGHPFAAAWRHGVLRQVRSVGVNQRGRLATGGGGHDLHDPRPTAVVGGSCAAAVQAADVPVA
jgi:hypothetical protein